VNVSRGQPATGDQSLVSVVDGTLLAKSGPLRPPSAKFPRGPGKAIDTDKLFVVASNMLGSSFGSTNAGSINPQTGEAYGPDFPSITIRDIVAAQKALLNHLGVRHLVAVAGPSYGGYQAFQWAVAYPDFMDAIAPVNTAPWASVNTDKQLAELQARRRGLTSRARAPSATAPRLPDAGRGRQTTAGRAWDLPGSDAIPSCVMGSSTSVGRQRLASRHRTCCLRLH
jgi:pimeloyl-ACP methyl ester carboxylesterase